jgi:cation:H+ antiporter
VLFGATVLAAATSLPELSTGLRSVVMATTVAVSDIFGGNAFPVLLCLQRCCRGTPCCQRRSAPTLSHGAGIVLTLIYAAGLLLARRIAGWG